MTPTEPGKDARIDELEVRIAHQDQAMHELGDELYRQQRQIARLESVVRQLAARLDSAALPEPEVPPADEVPPHY